MKNQREVERLEDELFQNIKRLFQELPIGLALCRMDGTLVNVNQAYADIIGYTIEETLHLTYWQITPNKYEKDEQKQVESLKSIGKYGPYEKEYIHKNGSYIPVRLNGKLLKIGDESYIWSSVEDITQRKIEENEIIEAKQIAEESEKMLKEAQAIAHIGNWRLDLLSNKLYWSDEVFRIFGCNPQEFTPTYEKFLEFIHFEDREKVTNTYNNHIKNKTVYNIIHRILLRNGEVKYVNERCNSIFDENGNATSSIGTVADITERIINEKELIEAKEKAEKANKAKSEFLSNMSHEIRTPMNAIVGFTEILTEIETENEKLEYLKIIKESNNHLLEIVNDILSISKIESGNYKVEYEEINIFEKIKTIVEIYKNQAFKKGIRLEFESDDKLNKIICVDIKSIIKILNNLLSNSIKFTNKGFVKISIRQSENNKLELVVEDTGIGISEKKQEKLYEPFEQGEYYLTKQYGGTGLGLAIVKKLVDMLSGEIDVKTEIDKGTVFRVSLPYEECNKRNLIDNEKLRIISAEDVEINQRLIEKFLEGEDIVLKKVYNGQELIDEIENNNYDLILMDIQMPVINGLEATKIIRNSKKYRTIPIVAVTAYAFEENINELIKEGVNDYVAKPIIRRELIEKIDKYKKR